MFLMIRLQSSDGAVSIIVTDGSSSNTASDSFTYTLGASVSGITPLEAIVEGLLLYMYYEKVMKHSRG